MGQELSYIVEALRPLAVPVEILHADPANTRTGHALDRIAASLEQYGQRKPLVVNKSQSNKIEAGNGTFQAATQVLKWEYIAAVFVEDDPATATGYGIADNRLGDLSEWDLDALMQAASSVDDVFTGFEPAELGDLIGVKEYTDDEEEGSGSGKSKDEIICPNCGHKFTKDGE